MREITIHKADEQDRQPRVLAVGKIGPGGAPQAYTIHYALSDGREYRNFLDFVTLDREGVTNEALLAIVIDRLECFQAGPYACKENELALNHARSSLACLQASTLARRERGVEGKAEA